MPAKYEVFDAIAWTASALFGPENEEQYHRGCTMILRRHMDSDLKTQIGQPLCKTVRVAGFIHVFEKKRMRPGSESIKAMYQSAVVKYFADPEAQAGDDEATMAWSRLVKKACRAEARG